MRKLLAVLALLLAGSGVAWADGMPQIVSATSSSAGGYRTTTVFNDSGGTLVSGAVVVWDNDDTEFDRSGNPYVTTTTTADFIWTAGLLLTDSCPDQSLCEIVTSGWAWANVTGNLTEDTVVSTSTTAGRIGDATAANNACYLGRLAENYNRWSTTTCGSSNLCQVPVLVTITCVP